MTRQRHRTLMVCANCHDHIHTGQPTTHLTAQITGEPVAETTRTTGSAGGHTGKGPAPQTPRRAAHPSIKVTGRWAYLYRTINQYGQVIDVLVSERRDLEATVLHPCARAPPSTDRSDHRSCARPPARDRGAAARRLPHHRAIHEQPDRSRSQPPEIPTTTDARSQTAALHPSNQHTTRLHPNLHRGHYELALDLHPRHRIPPRIR
jgi:IS6 family transposase